MRKIPTNSLPKLEPQSRAHWRGWLDEHHGNAPGVWLILRKREAGRRPLTLDDAIEEALCFGWIDSTLRPVDDERLMLRFTPRRAGSTWAASNKRRVARLIAQGSMTDAGMRVIDAARSDGSWDSLDAVEALQIPDDVARALAANPQAEASFTRLAPSARKQFLWWIQTAKRPETRAPRIAETVRLASQQLTLTSRPPKSS